MDVNQFKQKWIDASNQKERSVSQSHFLDLCALLGVPTPTEADPTGETYCFERGASKAGGGATFLPSSILLPTTRRPRGSSPSNRPEGDPVEEPIPQWRDSATNR